MFAYIDAELLPNIAKFFAEGGKPQDLADQGFRPKMNNLAIDPKKIGDLILTMNNKLNLLIEYDVGDDVGQMLPGGADAAWRLSPELKHLRM